MTDQEQVQQALAHLPRPAPPPRLHRNVMAKVMAEARLEAAGPQTHIWRRTQENGVTVEWRQGVTTSVMETAQQPIILSSVIHYTRRQNGVETIFTRSTETR